MTLPSHPPSRGTRLPRSSHSTASSCWRVHAKRFAIYYTVIILILFLWSGSFLKLHLEMHRENKQPVARVRGVVPKKRSKQDIASKLPLWNPQQHPSADVPLTGAYRYRPLDCKQQKNDDKQCDGGHIFFPAVDLKASLPYDEAMDIVQNIQRNTTQPSVTKKLFPTFHSHAVLTRGGNKDFTAAGSVTANQDRVLLLQFPKKHNFIMALLDGHGTDGHVVSHHAALTLPPVLSKQLLATSNQQQQDPREALTNTFLEMDATLPSESATGAGSTAICMLRLQNTLYIANTGDSLAFVASYDERNNGHVEIVYQTKPHKPNVPEERARIEAAGGQVVEAEMPGDSSRVIIPMKDDEHGGEEVVMALAMSRSIGDKEGAALGVIPNPTIDELNLTTLARGKQLFAVAASDGLFDRVSIENVAETLAKSFFGKTTVSPLEACEQLIMKSSLGWIANGMPYRDDISVATTILVRD